MENTKNTRSTHQKKFVSDFLEMTHSHPTAYDVVNASKRRGVKISVTTAYRLLNQMVLDGHAISLSGSDGQLHYDAMREDHIHFVCKDCGKIMDVFLPQQEVLVFAHSHGMNIGHIQEIVCYGSCDSCAKKKNS
jgi:Fur family peroxide stress response transcriptional regulator